MGYSDTDGELAVRIARDAVEAHVESRALSPFSVPAHFSENVGVFVTLNQHPDGLLRGCIGYPSPFFSLIKALLKAAEGACEDPRFPPLRNEEVDLVVVEVSLLTKPELIEPKRPKDYAKHIVIGEDGIIVAQGPVRGLLLPQVPIEWGWDAEEFLSEGCMKAGLLADAWLDESTRIYKFQSDVFAEIQPRGHVTRRNLKAEHARH